MAVRLIHRDVLEGLDVVNEALVNEHESNSRWNETRMIIFEFEGKFWRTYYDRGLTEYQDADRWDYQKEVPCEEVELREIVTIEKKWMAVND